MKELNGSGMVEAYHNQTLWDNRQTPRGTTPLSTSGTVRMWVTIDRANLNTPNKGKRKFGGFIHWDADTTLDPLPVNVQGVLALSDTSPESGGFQCYPELFNNLLAWRKSAARPQPVAAGPGDGAVPDGIHRHEERGVVDLQQPAGARHPPEHVHGSGAPGAVHFLYARPARQSILRDWRVQSWRERSAPQGYAFPGDPEDKEKLRYPQAQLSELGEKILGARAVLVRRHRPAGLPAG
jgi:hypothetical protein